MSATTRPTREGSAASAAAAGPAISLFSGAGGLDLGVERAGYEIRACVEYERDACATLHANFPETEVVHADITDLSTETILDAAGLKHGEPELVIGGPPCTPFSKSGYWLEYKRLGKDPDASLLEHFVRVVAEARPTSFLLENVYGLAYRNHNQEHFNRLLAALQGLGYCVSHRVLLAADYGVPQRRQRLFVLGSLAGTPAFPSPTHSGPHETRTRYDASLIPHATAGEAIGDLADRGDLAEPEEAVGGKYGHLLAEIPPGDNYLYFTDKRGHPNPRFGWRQRYWSFLLKLDPAQPSPTIQAQPGPYVGPFHWNNRRLRLPEVKRLQTFPDGYRVVGSRRSAQVQLGNAVPQALAAQVAEQLAALTGRSLDLAKAA